MGCYCHCSVTKSCPILCDPMDCSRPDFPVHHHSRKLLKCVSIELVMPSNHLVLCRPLLLPPSIFPSIRVFSNESVLCIRWPKYWSFSFNISPSNIQDWFPLGWTGWISVQSKGLSETSPTPQFKSINTSLLSFLYGPTFTSIHDYWKNHNWLDGPLLVK